MMISGSLLYVIRCAIHRSASYVGTIRYFPLQAKSRSRSLTMSTTSGTEPGGKPLTSPLQSLNVKKYSNSISLYANHNSSEIKESPRPLVLFLPWLGSSTKDYEKYIQIYFKLGFDVLVIESSLKHFMWPRTGLVYAGTLLDLLMAEKDLSSRRLFLHAMSIGGYMFAQMLVKSSKEQREMLDKICGQVFDSLVTGNIESRAKGVAHMVSSGFMASLIARGVLLYFSLLRAQTVEPYDKSIQAFWETPLQCPALFFYCMNDPMGDFEKVDELLQRWEKQGIQVCGKKWEKSVHAGHLWRHKEEYIDTLQNFIASIQNNTPKSKL